ncbi:MAG: NAD(P)-binding protein [Actinomycetia bacterium]|nr:NAD(P)-binding protein [Actinomycetes bacterium]MCG2819682.1 NAD(P)-binding protein [Actinomycetes bacterium]
MAENIVVGAGLAGLVAAINLVREGREVLVLERESRVGGSPLYHPSPEGTPVDLPRLADYTGIDISPAVARFGAGRAVIYGEMVPVDMNALSSVVIERGPRRTSLDSLLYGLAVEEGVKFEFNHPVISNDDTAKLPPDTIIATGLYFEGFDALRVPYLTSFHFVTRRKVPADTASHVTIYHGRFTSDYAYTCSVNGIQFAHVFQRRPIGKDTLHAFTEQAFVSEGIELDEWEHFTFPVPAAHVNNPRLFAGDKILAGTLAGCMESYMFFGMLGALVSGKIAAMAVEDKARAYQEFKLATSAFRSAYLMKKMGNMAPHWLHRLMLREGITRLSEYPAAAEVVKRAMPGWRNCERAGE